MKTVFAVLCVFALPAFCAAQAPSLPERDLWSLWQYHAKNTNDHAGVAAACMKFEKDAAHAPFLPVARGIAAWRLLKCGNTNACVKVLESMIAPAADDKVRLAGADPAEGDPLREAGADMARTWLTRLDREQAVKVLRQYYVRHVEYPATMQFATNLAPEQKVALTDRWGQAWQYRATGFTRLAGLNDQRYVLQSARLGDDSGLAEALARNYAERIGIEKARVVSSGAGGVLELVVPPRPEEGSRKNATDGRQQSKVVVAVGRRAGGIYAAFIGARLLVLADFDHWLVLPRPGVAGPL
jgi:hypothetical protein